MKVPYSYYEDEVREGFYVPSLMKRAWAASIEVYEVVASICNKHHIQFFADAGTLLGAIRHKGFIPWDDDIDICMKRDDYNRFISIVQQELPEGYQMESLYTTPDYDEIFARIVNRDAISFAEEELNKSHGFPFVTGLDIFPLDYLSQDKEEEKTRCDLALMIYGIITNLDQQIDEAVLEEHLKNLEDLCKTSINRNKDIKNQLYILLERLFMLYHESEATELAVMPLWVERGIFHYRKEYFQDTIMIPFEQIEVPVPAMYDSVLKVQYGDYMFAAVNGSFHDYPFYEKQLDILEERAGVTYPKYVFTKSDLLREELSNDHKVIRHNKRERLEVVFLPYKASMWDSFKPMWQLFQQDDDYDVYVIPIPYYHKKHDGTVHDVHYEKDLYPDYVPVTYYEDYIFQDRQPDIIFIQNPFDEYNLASSVHPFFYSINLRKFTNKLIYLSHFALNDSYLNYSKVIYTMQYFVAMPGVVQADWIILPSEAMRKAYIEYLTELAGSDSRKIWEEKILIAGSPEIDNVLFCK